MVLPSDAITVRALTRQAISSFNAI